MEQSVAKQTPSKTGTSRIRFIMLDAEIPDGELGEITAAIQNALKPTTTIVQQRLSGVGQAPTLIEIGRDTQPSDDVLLEGEEADAAPALATKPARSSKPRKPTTPDVLELDLTSGVSLESFADEHPAKSELDRNLIIAAWLKEHRELPAITAAHVYTGYRALGWSVGFEDFSWPLRTLKKDKFMSSPARGEYAINHLGIARVLKLSKGE